ncbi:MULTISPECIES: type II toxin-antitoxin system RelE/ParE family toxin [unclassified Caballeronia]|uniref:type II toxin-antitoxin system RelE/ParE family toxin n=1 Tax=unclassified Caballeronia TaxID=2646786 RepID=UPI00285681F8|nr:MULTISPECIES: type II toxin-antitoxin system RelE/ParE family toxin [unclassified Caballeronia]MDR5823449.1 type II toxin-antitoxin system RelE/ParE family toxin [Caballeronia sp. LZ043]MDR5878471.1 type II toxin-antitoxin system RelE/ParE family toxin [Caballeronia sp. LZ032]
MKIARLRINFYTTHQEKALRWLGSSFHDLLDFPAAARREAGFQLGRPQFGLDPEDWKPFDALGPGARKIRIRDPSGAYCVMSVAKLEEAVYVLHCFKKKSQETSQKDKEIATVRYRAIASQRKTSS